MPPTNPPQDSDLVVLRVSDVRAMVAAVVADVVAEALAPMLSTFADLAELRQAVRPPEPIPPPQEEDRLLAPLDMARALGMCRTKFYERTKAFGHLRKGRYWPEMATRKALES